MFKLFKKKEPEEEEEKNDMPVRFEYEEDAQDKTKLVIDYIEVKNMYIVEGNTVLHLRDGRIVYLPEWV